ncbi:MAG: fused MFS/spermidine synthase, partial [Acidobacteriota bacterium]
MSDQPTSHSPLAAVSRIRFFAIVTLPAAVLMALEMVSSRLLAPEFGNSVYVWGSIIGVFLATMSAGYWFGGRLADQHPNLVTLGGVLLASGCFQALVLIFGRPATAWLGAVTGGSPEGVLVATFVLFGAPTVFLAMVSPFVVKIAADDLDALGGTAGQLYALSTGGSLVGTLGATFVLIPRMGLEPIFALLLAATAVSAFLCLGPAWRTQRLATVLGIALQALAVIPDDLFRTTDLQVVAERLSPYQTLRVVETGDMRYLYSDGALHASVDKRDGSSTMVYSKIAAAGLLLQPETKRLAVLGMGGGNVGRHLSDLVPSLEVDYVEVDPAIPELAETYLGFVPGPRHRVHVADARRFLVDR